MGQYKTSIGQNIYDIALHIYGSLDGLTDLLINNPSLSLSLPIKPDTLLTYTDNLFVNSNVVSTLISNNVTPANGSADIYYKEDPSDRIIDIICKPTQKVAEIGLSGNGVLLIDWGDNSDIQEVKLQSNKIIYQHVFKNKIKQNRKIKFFGSVQFIDFDISNLDAINMFFLKNINIEKYIHCASKCEIEHLRLCDGVYNLSLKGAKITDLSPLLELKDLITLDLNSQYINSLDIENYFIGLVQNYGNRRGCTISINSPLRGVYKEPDKDNNNKYIFTSAMEAIWVLLNEPLWQEGGFWHVIINNKDYTAEGNVDVINFFHYNLGKIEIITDKAMLKAKYNSLNSIIKDNSSTILLPVEGNSDVVYGLNNVDGGLVPFSFSRESSGTFFNINNEMQLSGINIPRIDYGNYNTNAKLLIEKEATNYVGLNTLFVNNGTINITDDVVHYVSNNTPDTLHGFYTPTYTEATNSKNSLWLKYGGCRYVVLRGVVTENYYIIVDTINKSVVYKSPANLQTEISLMHDDWFVIKYDQSKNPSGRLTLRLSDNTLPNGNPNSIGNGTGVFAKNIQVEPNQYTSYIPTTNSSVTRAADKLMYSIPQTSSIYLKTTKREVVLIKNSGQWNIHDDLDYEGVEVLAVFNRILTESESLDILKNPIINRDNGLISNYDLSKSLLSVNQIRMLLLELQNESFAHNANVILHTKDVTSSLSDLIQIYNSNFISIIIQ